MTLRHNREPNLGRLTDVSHENRFRRIRPLSRQRIGDRRPGRPTRRYLNRMTVSIICPRIVFQLVNASPELVCPDVYNGIKDPYISVQIHFGNDRSIVTRVHTRMRIHFIVNQTAETEISIRSIHEGHQIRPTRRQDVLAIVIFTKIIGNTICSQIPRDKAITEIGTDNRPRRTDVADNRAVVGQAISKRRPRKSSAYI